ncbi:hypothetical protein A8C32_17320 [Flavivirga aquatica]|uniref:Tetratricopeptide repeat protein n=1 Tax=Flavivirga aquatica TaxID=1849968 RepID=A0A1E5T8C2_9FLAO|nr:hypothetical protein [Flavivirga aquatica]OEK07557.1 hypothetical protein A8C32_17320 [Flavivirga aquatica]
MKHLIIIATLLVSGLINSQTNYEKGMQKAFELWKSNNTIEASNMYERIAKAEPDNWLPPYYAAQINIVGSFGEKDKEVLIAKLKKGQDLINIALTISKDNPEILVLQALLHTAWVAFDGATYGMTLSGKVVELYTKALKLAPKNPRVVYCKAEWDMGAAKFFGQDTSSFCKDLEYAIELFANFKRETPFHPNWGENRAIKIFDTCKK